MIWGFTLFFMLAFFAISCLLLIVDVARSPFEWVNLLWYPILFGGLVFYGSFAIKAGRTLWYDLRGGR